MLLVTVQTPTISVDPSAQPPALRTAKSIRAIGIEGSLGAYERRDELTGLCIKGGTR